MTIRNASFDSTFFGISSIVLTCFFVASFAISLWV